MSIINLKKNDKLTKELIDIINNKNNLMISFDNDYNTVVNSFFSNLPIKNTNDYYTISNHYFYQIDLLEYSLKNNLNIYTWFINCIEIADNIINSKSNKYIELFGSNVNNWNISLSNNIMFNYPFTLDNIIFFPINFIIEEFNINRRKRIINTLIHEKIHIAQRFNELDWEKFIQQNNPNWKKINSKQIEFNIIDSNLSTNQKLLDEKFIFVFNPDTTYNDFKYIWVNDEKKYYGHFVCNKQTKKIIKKYFELNIEKRELVPVKIDLKEEHPYEIYAYEISEKLTVNL